MCIRDRIEIVHKENALPTCDGFYESVDAYGLKFSEWVARHWQLPPAIFLAIAELRECGHGNKAYTPLGKALYMGDILSKMAILASEQPLLQNRTLIEELSPRAKQYYRSMRDECLVNNGFSSS